MVISEEEVHFALDLVFFRGGSNLFAGEIAIKSSDHGACDSREV